MAQILYILINMIIFQSNLFGLILTLEETVITCNVLMQWTFYENTQISGDIK